MVDTPRPAAEPAEAAPAPGCDRATGIELGEDGRVHVTSPWGLKALAHPARQAALTRLYDGDVLTATSLARVAGVTPSAMSYHLRALQRWGLVRRDESTDGRERPWRATGTSLVVTPTAVGTGDLASAGMLVGSFLTPLQEHVAEIRDWLAAPDRARSDLDGALGSMSTSRVWVTDEEAEALITALGRAVEAYRRPVEERPEGSWPFETYVAVLPRLPGEDGEPLLQARHLG